MKSPELSCRTCPEASFSPFRELGPENAVILMTPASKNCEFPPNSAPASDIRGLGSTLPRNLRGATDPFSATTDSSSRVAIERRDDAEAEGIRTEELLGAGGMVPGP